MPSPLVVCSSTITWPLFSPPRPAPDTSMPSRMYLSPTGVRMTWPPARSTAAWSPPFESTDTTSPPFAEPAVAPAAPARGCRGPGRRRRCGRRRRRRSAGRRRHRARTRRRRRAATTASASAAGAVAPQRTLMFTPSGSLLMTTTSAPVAARISGPTTPPEPFAQSSTIRSRRADGPCEPQPVLAVAIQQRAAPRRPVRVARSGRPAAPRPARSAARARPRRRRRASGPRSSSTLRPLSSAGLWEAETMIPAANSGWPARNASAGVGRTPVDVDVDAERRRPGRDGRHEHVAGSPRVLADDQRIARAHEPMGGRAAEGVRQAWA